MSDAFKIKLLPEFGSWLDRLRDPLTKRRLLVRLRKASLGNLGDVKQVGTRVWEMRENFGPGWRMYFTLRANVMIVMLCGGNKSSQQPDIERAIQLERFLED